MITTKCSRRIVNAICDPFHHRKYRVNAGRRGTLVVIVASEHLPSAIFIWQNIKKFSDYFQILCCIPWRSTSTGMTWNGMLQCRDILQSLMDPPVRPVVRSMNTVLIMLNAISIWTSILSDFNLRARFLDIVQLLHTRVPVDRSAAHDLGWWIDETGQHYSAVSRESHSMDLKMEYVPPNEQFILKSLLLTRCCFCWADKWESGTNHWRIPHPYPPNAPLRRRLLLLFRGPRW